MQQDTCSFTEILIQWTNLSLGETDVVSGLHEKVFTGIIYFFQR